MDLDEDELKATRDDFFQVNVLKNTDQDSYGDVIGTENTYKSIAKALKSGESVVIGYTDQEFSRYDVLFTYHPLRPLNNYLQRGLKWTDLFVSVLGISSFGFSISDCDINSGYIAEKLCLNNSDCTSLALLINGVIKYIVKGDNCSNE